MAVEDTGAISGAEPAATDEPTRDAGVEQPPAVGESTPAVEAGQNGWVQAPHSAAEDQLAESLALDHAVDDPRVPAPPLLGRHRDATLPGPFDDDPPRPALVDLGGSDGPPSGRLRRGRTRKARRKAPWWELPLLIAVAVVVAMLIKTFLVQPYYIPSQSMEKTLHGCPGCSGDRILVNKPIYDLRAPHPGDIVVFKAPAGWDDEAPPAAPSNPILHAIRWAGQLVGVVPPDENDLVKRVIAIGGQTVKCCDSAGNVQISDTGPAGPFRSLSEPYIYQPVPLGPVAACNPSASSDGEDRSFGPVTVPKGRLWVMGDHRSVSEDSRWHYEVDDCGNAVNSTVPVSAVIGKAVLIVWPPPRWTTLGTPSTFKVAALGAAGPAAPPLVAAGVVAPIWLLRRRRRQYRTEPAASGEPDSPAARP